MSSFPISFLRSLFQQAVNIGVQPGFEPGEVKRTRVLNLMVIVGQLLNVVFIFINLFEAHYLNAAILFANIVCGVIFLVTNYYHYTQAARILLTILSTFGLSITAILFQNGNEYYLIANSIIIAVILRHSLAIILISLLNFAIFIAIRYFDLSDFVYDALPAGRIYYNMSAALLLCMLVMLYYRQETRFYERELENSQRRLQLNNQELEESNTTKEKIFSIIAHDLRSPIAQLHNTLDLLQKGMIDPKQFHEFIEHIGSQVKQLRVSMDNLLQWSNSQLEGIEANPRKVILAPILEQIEALMRIEIEQKQIRVHKQLDATAVWVDADHLLLLLRNLLSNAIKYSFKGGAIHISAKQWQHQVIITIADQGCGMDEATLQSLFSSANLVSRQGTMNEKGTGLGLKLVKEFVEKNQGRVWAEHNQPQGAVFNIALPSSI